jgi:hypothetical protein
MKKTPLVLLIPFVVVLLVVGAAVIMKQLTPKPTPVVTDTKPSAFPNALSQSEIEKPSSFLGSLFVKATATPTPTKAATASDLSTELKGTYDDGGQAELDALAKDAASL